MTEEVVVSVQIDDPPDIKVEVVDELVVASVIQTGPMGPGSTVPGPEGPQGDVGPQGAASTVPGPQGPPGNSPQFVGAWSSTRAYVPLDNVRTTAGNSFVALVPNTNVDPQGAGSVGVWEMVARAGAPSVVPGPQGIQGPVGPPGTSTVIVGSVPTFGDLPAPGSVNSGDSYIVESDGDLWVSTGTAWVDAGQIVGPQGPQGIQGVKGDTGSTGASGGMGPAGETWVVVTQAEYDALTPDSDTLYIVVG